MKNRFVLSILVLFFFLHVFAQDGISESKWQSKQLSIDGDDNEWPQPHTFFDAQSALMFSVSNDAKNLYLCFSNNDRMKTGKMMKAGWSIELFSSEKKRKFDATIIFPKSIDPGISMRSDFNAAVEIYKSEIQTLKTKGFQTNNLEIKLSNNQDIQVAVGADSLEKIVYEIKIPLKELMDENLVQLNEIISLELTINSLDKPKSSSSQEGTRSSFGGGGGAHGGGRSGGGHGGGHGGGGYNNQNLGGYDRSGLYEKVSFKQKIKLVKQ